MAADLDPGEFTAEQTDHQLRLTAQIDGPAGSDP